jgi:glycosyltransferase involved in cell wall biosynthesis
VPRRLTVWIDGCAFENTHQNGVWRVFFETARRNQDRADLTLWLQDEPRQPLPPDVRVHRDRRRSFPGRSQLVARVRAFCARQLAPPAALARADIFHSSYYSPCPLPGPAEVTTVHDMIAERHYSICGNWAVGEIERKRTCILRSRVCICVSRATAHNLVRFYPEVAARVRVIHLGSDHVEMRTRDVADGADQPYALFVGNRDFHKNFVLVLDALRRPEWPSRLRLHVVGSPFAPHESALVRALGLADRINHLGRLSDQMLTFEYEHASCVLIPSLDEGFCLPILEAQRSGCPVVASDIPVFHEVAGSAALFFDPRLAEALAEAASASLEHETRTRLREGGYANSASFSWATAAEQIAQVYSEVSSSRHAS